MTYPFHYDPPKAADPGTEIAIQTRFRARMKIWAPDIKLFAIPNSGKRTAWQAMQAKREGLSAGVPDIQALWNGGHAFLEFKAGTGALSGAQYDWLHWLHANGHPCGVFRSVDTAMAFLRRCGAPFLAEAA